MSCPDITPSGGRLYGKCRDVCTATVLWLFMVGDGGSDQPVNLPALCRREHGGLDDSIHYGFLVHVFFRGAGDQMRVVVVHFILSVEIKNILSAISIK